MRSSFIEDTDIEYADTKETDERAKADHPFVDVLSRALARARRRVSGVARTLSSLRAQLTLWYVALLLVILIAFSALLDASLTTRLHQQIDSNLTTVAEQARSTLDVENGQIHLGDAVGNLPEGTIVALYSSDGRQLLGTTNPNFVQRLGPATVPTSSSSTTLRTVSGPDHQNWRVLTQAIGEGKGTQGIILVARSEEEIDATLQQLLLIEGVAIPLVLLLAVGGGLFLAGRALDPIDRITRTAGAIGEHDLGQRLSLPARGDEVGRLATTFDAMLDRLDRAFQRQRQFTADASHELRTPLSIIRSRAEVSLDRKRTAKEYRETLEVIRDEATQLGQLVAELLTLARADAHEEPIGRERVALGDLVYAVVNQVTPLAEDREVEVHAGTVEEIDVFGDATRLAQLLINLVDNAVKYTSAGGAVRVDLTERDGFALLVVADSGVGIAPEHLPHLFERFYRVDRARSGGGAGLGLAICDWIVRSHGGKIQVESIVGKGSTFRVILPAAPPADERSTDRSSDRSPTESPTDGWSGPTEAKRKVASFLRTRRLRRVKDAVAMPAPSPEVAGPLTDCVPSPPRPPR